MELTNDFAVGVPIARAWEVLTDLERIAPCMPGAKLEEVEGEEYRGLVKVKVGPVTAQYKGAAHFVERDDEAYRAVLEASGRDTRGQGNANATITATLEEVGGRTEVHLVTDLSITGKVAQFGRGVMVDVSAKLIGQFVENLESTVLADSTQEGESEPSEEAVVAAVRKAQTAKKAAKKATKKAAKKATKKATAKKAPESVAKSASKPEEGLPGTVAAEAATAPKEETVRDDPSTTAQGTEERSPVSGNGTEPDRQPGVGVSPAGTSTSTVPTVRKIDSPDPQPIDMMDAAGASVAKRILPVVLVAGVVVVFVWLGRHRCRQRKS